MSLVTLVPWKVKDIRMVSKAYSEWFCVSLSLGLPQQGGLYQAVIQGERHYEADRHGYGRAPSFVNSTAT